MGEQKVVYTSYYGATAALREAGIKPIGISAGVPPWFNGNTMKRLAPRREMLKMAKAEYDVEFQKILSDLDPQACWDALPHNSAILCWETPNVRCHRRQVAEWLESKLGVVVTEFGFERSQVLPYDKCPGKWEAKKLERERQKEVKKKANPQQFMDFG